MFSIVLACFQSRVGVRSVGPISYAFSRFLSKAEENNGNGLYAFLQPLLSVETLGCSFGGCGLHMERFCGHRQNMRNLSGYFMIFVWFCSFGLPSGSPKAFLEVYVGANCGSWVSVWAHFVQLLRKSGKMTLNRMSSHIPVKGSFIRMYGIKFSEFITSLVDKGVLKKTDGDNVDVFYDLND